MTNTNANFANLEQREHWNAHDAQHWVAYQDHYDRALAGFGARILDGAAIEPTDRVLDIGCGCGATTRDAARRARAGRSLGVDLSAPMLDAARRRAAEENLTNVAFEQGDAQTYAFEPATFDVAISRFGIMFFSDPVAAFANIRSALRVGGRISFACWQDMFANEWIAVPAGAAIAHVPMPDLGEPGAPGPFAFADPDRVRSILNDAGFNDVSIEPVNESLRLGATLDDTMTFVADTDLATAVFAQAEPAAVERALAAIRDALAPHTTDDGVHLGAAAWEVSATA